MKVSRSKQVRKYLRFFSIVYGIDTRVYHVILDGNFIFAAIKFKVDIAERLAKLLQVHELKMYVTQSVVNELTSVGPKAQSALEFAKRFCEVIDDGHLRGDNATDKTVALMKQQHQEWLAAPTSRKRRYIVASQDKDLRCILAHVPGIPLLYLNKVTMVLEPPSTTSKEFNREIEVTKVSLRPAEAQLVETLKKKKKRPTENVIGELGENSACNDGNEDVDEDVEEEDEEDEPDKPAPRKKHKAMAANPLASRAATSDSFKQKKLKKDKYRR